MPREDCVLCLQDLVFAHNPLRNVDCCNSTSASTKSSTVTTACTLMVFNKVRAPNWDGS